MGTVIGLVVGLALGIFIGVIFISPIHTGAGINNQVQVSGTVSETQASQISFASVAINSSSYGQISSSSLIINGQYSVVLVGGRSYQVLVYYQGTYRSYSLYVPSGIATFTANF